MNRITTLLMMALLALSGSMTGQIFTDKEGNPFSGIFRTYYRNGSIKSQTYYKDGMPVGLMQEWHENGVVKSEKHYLHLMGEPVINGPVYAWNSDGKLILVKNYMWGKLDGEWIR
ncbi:toxin-antitoxin system YwqK family antitoxin [Saccharicrinis sp. FJH2]|uniref:toxin-antitoxin system YwqK family antitoxin n=1 Tax=Saccharicrinis sp. FJH65 TaxID=3344659 RepID=UPI0035F291AA